MAELDAIRPKIGCCETGKAVVTGAGRLNAKVIIHAVGPIYRGGANGEAELLASCYRESLRLAAERSLRSIAFPSISTGIYGYPMEEAAGVAIASVRGFLQQPSSIEDVRFVLFGSAAYVTFSRVLSS